MKPSEIAMHHSSRATKKHHIHKHRPTWHSKQRQGRTPAEWKKRMKKVRKSRSFQLEQQKLRDIAIDDVLYGRRR